MRKALFRHLFKLSVKQRGQKTSLEKDNSLNHYGVSPKMGCFEYTQLRTKYQQATKDVQLKAVTKCHSSILVFGDSFLTVGRAVRVRIWRGDNKCILICKHSANPGRKACVGMKLIQYMTNDALHKPPSRVAQDYAVERDL